MSNSSVLKRQKIYYTDKRQLEGRSLYRQWKQVFDEILGQN